MEQGTRDTREELIENLTMYCMSISNENPQDVKNKLYMLMQNYEVQSRCTEIVELQQDRNDYLLERFVIAKTIKGCSKRTIEFYSYTIRFFNRYMQKTFDQVTTEDIRYYLAIRQGRDKISKVYADNERRNLSSFFTFLTDEEYIAKNPMRHIESIKIDKKKKEAFTELEIEKLRSVVKDERESLIVEMLLSTGCRVSELVNIKLDEIENDRVLVHGKGAKDRYVYMNAKAQLALEKYMTMRKDGNPYLLPGGYYRANVKDQDAGYCKWKCAWWKHVELVSENEHLNSETVASITRRMAKETGIKKANPHKFRRTCATMALRRGMPIEQVSKMLGHESIETTQIYLDLSEEDLSLMHKKYVV